MNQPLQNQPFDKSKYAKVTAQVKTARSNLFLVASNCTIHVDGVQVASKIRWY